MLDRRILDLAHGLLESVAGKLVTQGIKADHVSWLGFSLGLAAVPLITLHQEFWAIACILLNRLADGIDGSIALKTRPTDRGAFLDIALDFLFYSSIPLAFALANPQQNGLAAAVLIYAFVGTGSAFLAFAIIAASKLPNTDYPEKGFYYLGGLTEATETILAFILMCLLPDHFLLAYGSAALCALTTITRIAAGMKIFKDIKG